MDVIRKTSKGNKIYQMQQVKTKLQKRTILLNRNKLQKETNLNTLGPDQRASIPSNSFFILMLSSRRSLAGCSVSRRQRTKSPILDHNPSTEQGTQSSFSALTWRNVCQQLRQPPIPAHMQVLPLGLHHSSPPVACKDWSLGLERVPNGRPKSLGGFHSVVEVAICKPCPFR